MAPPQPWAYNSGHSKAIIIDSQRTFELYRRAGIEERQLATLGSLIDDELAVGLQCAEQRRADLYEELDLPEGRPLLLCALPPNQFSGRPAKEFASYKKLIRGWIEPLAELSRFNVVV